LQDAETRELVVSELHAGEHHCAFFFLTVEERTGRFLWGEFFPGTLRRVDDAGLGSRGRWWHILEKISLERSDRLGRVTRRFGRLGLALRLGRGRALRAGAGSRRQVRLGSPERGKFDPGKKRSAFPQAHDEVSDTFAKHREELEGMDPRDHDEGDHVDDGHYDDRPDRAEELLDELVPDAVAEEPARALGQIVSHRPVLEKPYLELDEAGRRADEEGEGKKVPRVERAGSGEDLDGPPREHRRDKETGGTEEKIGIPGDDGPDRADEVHDHLVLPRLAAEGDPGREISGRVGDEGEHEHHAHPRQHDRDDFVKGVRLVRNDPLFFGQLAFLEGRFLRGDGFTCRSTGLSGGHIPGKYKKAVHSGNYRKRQKRENWL